MKILELMGHNEIIKKLEGFKERGQNAIGKRLGIKSVI